MKHINLSLCRIQNYNMLNCLGFDLEVNLLGFKLKMGIHSREQTLRVYSRFLWLSYHFPKYLSVRRFRE